MNIELEMEMLTLTGTLSKWRSGDMKGYWGLNGCGPSGGYPGEEMAEDRREIPPSWNRWAIKPYPMN